MCGIAGSVSLCGELSPENVEVVRRINLHQRRRGPDGEGLWVADDKRVALGHRRLAIIDVGNAGAQPMSDVTGRWAITFNGEIYNYRELRIELQALGRKFATRSDTEVLLNCFAEWGEAGLRKLRGMYAFAIWDHQEKALWLVRDPFGIKPLYYSESGSNFWFASQARALAECAPVNTARNPAGLVGFYLWGSVPDPFTWWEGVHAVPAGHIMRVSQGRGVPAARSFQDIADAYTAAPAQPISQSDLKSALVDSVGHHFVADVSVGVFLSAGIDSTLIASLAKDAGFKLKTVTLAFEEFKGTPLDEAPLAEETARMIGSDHVTVRVSRDEFLGLFDDLMETMDQPTTDGLNTYLVSRAAASTGLKVVLSGLGGDELFGGYPSFRQVPNLVSFGNKVPFREAMGNIIAAIGRPISAMLNISPKISAALKYSGNLESAYLLRRCLYLPEELERLVDETWSQPGLQRLAGILPGGDPRRTLTMGKSTLHGAVSQLEVKNYMRHQPLRDTDWASMAHSLEIRVPFLDLPLLTRLAPAISSKNPPTKLELAKCAWPTTMRMSDRSKTGFVTPISTWLREGPARRRGLRPWADKVAAQFRDVGTSTDVGRSANSID